MRNDAERMMDLARRALAHYQAKTTDQADEIMAQPVAAYSDPERYARETERIFKRLPLALALSLELPEPGSCLALEMLGIPVVMIRGTDGRARAFLNACRHRGAPVCPPGRGQGKSFTCPYHAWSYDTRGRLIAVYGEETFGEIDRDSHSLLELPCAERVGLVWVALEGDATFDIDDWLGDFAEELGHLALDKWHLYEQRDLDGPGWKVTWDGYLEAYHHNSLHGRTVGKYTVGNLLLHDVWGPHQRITFGRRSLSELAGQPEAAWQPEKHVRLIHSVFPNLSFSGVVGDHCLVSLLFPGPTPETTVTRQTILAANPPDTEEAEAASRLFSDLVLQAVRDEDYDMGFKIQAGLRAGGNRDFLYGRNEPAVQHYHRMIAKFAAEG